MFQFLLTILIVVMGMVNGYLYNEVRFLKTDLKKVEKTIQTMEASASSQRVEQQALEFIESFQDNSGEDILAASQEVEEDLIEENDETVEIVDGNLKGFLDVENPSAKVNGQSVVLEFKTESENLANLVAQNLGGVIKIGDFKYQVSLGCVNNSGILKSQIFSLSNNDSQMILGGKFENLRLFFSPKVGFVGKSCQSPLSSVQILD